MSEEVVASSKRAKVRDAVEVEPDSEPEGARDDEGDEEEEEDGVEPSGENGASGSSTKGRKRKTLNFPGLRETSYTVLQVLRKNEVCSKAELVDALRARYVKTGDIHPDDLNTLHKRVSDVINVLIAMRMVKRDEDKRLRYEGDPVPDTLGLYKAGSDAPETQSMPEDLGMLTDLVTRKRDQLVRLMVHHLLVDALIQRNEGAADVPEDSKVTLPFVVISAKEGTQCEVEMGENAMVLNFDGEFELRDDVEILHRMGLLSEITAAKIKEVVPMELFEFLPPVLRSRLQNSANEDAARRVA